MVGVTQLVEPSYKGPWLVQLYTDMGSNPSLVIRRLKTEILPRHMRSEYKNDCAHWEHLYCRSNREQSSQTAQDTFASRREEKIVCELSMTMLQ